MISEDTTEIDPIIKSTASELVVEIDFASTRPRTPDQDLEGDNEDAVSINNRFKLELHRQSSSTADHVVIVVNGFGQLSEYSYNNPKDGLCPRLASRGLPALLLPLPFHMRRWPGQHEPYRSLRSPTMLVLRNKERFYDGYIQMMADIEYLVEKVSTAGFTFSGMGGARRTVRVHLLGHSMGGLAVLAYQLFAKLSGKRVCDSTILLASGCSMRTIHPREIGLDSNKWLPLRKFYLKDFPMCPSANGHNELYHQVFRQIFLGKRMDAFDSALEEWMGRTLVIVGAEDEVNALQYVSSGLDNIPKYLTLVIPEWGHLLQAKGESLTPEWAKWSDFVLDAIAVFVKRRTESKDSLATNTL